MNPLEDYPHLFANGKFKLHHTEGNWVFTGDDAETIIRAPEKDNWPKWTQEVKLIARPISDMTKKEIEELLYWDTYDGQSIGPDSAIIWRDRLEEQVNRNEVNLNSFLYLLSVGVYPFNQKHFNDGTVIDATKLEATPE